MAIATIRRANGPSIDLPLVEEGGQPVHSVDYGKPNLNIQKTGAINPRHIDQWSGLESHNLLGRFLTDTAYQDAIALCDLIKSNSNGDPLYLDLTDLPEFDSEIMVAPAAGQDAAVEVAYNPGRRNWVDVDLGLTRVNQTLGGSDQPASTPTGSGSGPIELAYGGTAVALERGIEVSRSVGRPQSVVRKDSSSEQPYFIDKHKTAADSFELSLEFGSQTVSKVQSLVEMFSQQLGRSSLELRFNGVYGLGTFNVVPSGSGALRHVRRSGEENTVIVPTVQLRRVLQGG
jgi:hypothetical protein